MGNKSTGRIERTMRTERTPENYENIKTRSWAITTLENIARG